jgi:hypothetical protein
MSEKANLRGDAVGRAIFNTGLLSFRKNWNIVNPKLIRDSEVRTTAIKVLSLLMAVRSSDISVRLDAITVAGSRGISVMKLRRSAIGPSDCQSALKPNGDPDHRGYDAASLE